MLQKKKWIVKMVILDAKDAKISDISQIKCFDNSSKNLNITSKNVSVLQKLKLNNRVIDNESDFNKKLFFVVINKKGKKR